MPLASMNYLSTSLDLVQVIQCLKKFPKQISWKIFTCRSPHSHPLISLSYFFSFATILNLILFDFTSFFTVVVSVITWGLILERPETFLSPRFHSLNCDPFIL